MANSNVARLALLGGPRAVDRPAPRWPMAGDLEVAWMEGVVRSGKWSWLGPHERAFCEEFSSLTGARHAMLLANGTVTIQVALKAVGVQPGDQVIVPGLTWTATMQAALDISADVVLVDVDPETFCIDPAAVEAAITPKTKAVVPVQIYGCMCDMDALTDIAKRHNLKIVEDAAHQHGSRWRNRGAGSLGDAGSFSFQSSKALTCGEGGAITCNDDAVFEAAFCLKHVGWMPDVRTPGRRYGHNFRATEMQAVLLRGGLRRFGDQMRVREENAQILAEGLREIGGALRTARRDPRVTRQSYYALTLHYDKTRALGLERSQYMRALSAEGVSLSVPYPPVYRHDILNLYDATSPVPYREATISQNYAELRLPVTERLCAEEGLVMGHLHLLGERAYIEQLLTAVLKVQDHLPDLQKHFAEA
ncbi:MAG: DegT/DnrJ/EryC1/StrS family aminotransferase [Armatimonadetes bacterium]|nr:DegT/DnrJ/EryC1/StrS family aminotransferase [Armatimonadota bacterium]